MQHKETTTVLTVFIVDHINYLEKNENTQISYTFGFLAKKTS